VARCTVERLTRELGLSGARRGRARRNLVAINRGCSWRFHRSLLSSCQGHFSNLVDVDVPSSLELHFTVRWCTTPSSSCKGKCLISVTRCEDARRHTHR
jgi:hypothetical protein